MTFRLQTSDQSNEASHTKISSLESQVKLLTLTTHAVDRSDSSSNAQEQVPHLKRRLEEAESQVQLLESSNFRLDRLLDESEERTTRVSVRLVSL